MSKIIKCLLPLILLISAPSVFATSDTTAPQLVSVDFTPKSVDVSGASQVVTVTAHLIDTGSTCSICGNSGVNSASFYFYSPSGNQWAGAWFGSYNRVSGTAQDGIYQTTLTIPKSSESGNWTMRNGGVSDVVQNHTYYSVPGYGYSPYPSGTPTTLAVTSTTADATGPQLVSVDFTPKSVDVSSGSQVVTLTAHLTDDNTGINSAQFDFNSPSNNQGVSVSFNSSNRVSGTAQDGIYQTTLTIPKSSENGNWTMRYVFIYDAVRNHTYYSAFPTSGWLPYPSGTPTTLAVTSTTADTTAPQLVSVDFTPKSVNVSSGSQVVTITAHLTDDNTGVNFAQFAFYSPSGNQSVWVYVGSYNRVSGTAQDGIYQTTLTIPKASENGNWTLTYGSVFDVVENNTAYSVSAWGYLPFPSGTPTTLAVACATADKTAPQLVSVDFTPKSVEVSNASQVVTLTTHLTDDNTGLNYATFYFYSPSGNQSVAVSVNSSNRVSGTAQDGIYQTTLTIPKLSESGNWIMTYVYVFDGAQNHTNYSALPTNGYLPYPSGTPTVLAVANALTKRFETESLQVASITPPPTGVPSAQWFGKFTASGASGGAGTYFNANAKGNYITYTLPVANPGIYQIRVGIQTKPNKGKFQLAINGVNLGQPQDEYNPSVTYVARELGTVSFSTAGNYAVKFTVTGKNASSSGYTVAFDYIELIPTTRFQTESLKVQAKTPPPSGVGSAQWFGKFNDPAASGGAGTYFNANGINNYITYTLPVLKAGTYQVRVGIQTKPNKGIFQLAINGLNVGQPQDEYTPSVMYIVRDLGTVSFSVAGNYAFKFTVTGKNENSIDYRLAFDYIELIPE